jgi:hypothetical protein
MADEPPLFTSILWGPGEPVSEWPGEGTFQVTLRWKNAGGRMEVVGLEVTTTGDRPLTRADLRRLPLHEIAEELRATEAAFLRISAAGDVARREELTRRVAEWEAGASRRIRLQSHGAAFYREVAETYMAAEHNPTQAVARHFGGVPDSTVKGGFSNYAAAAQWIWRCRRDGFLPSAKKRGTL